MYDVCKTPSNPMPMSIVFVRRSIHYFPVSLRVNPRFMLRRWDCHLYILFCCHMYWYRIHLYITTFMTSSLTPNCNRFRANYGIHGIWCAVRCCPVCLQYGGWPDFILVPVSVQASTLCSRPSVIHHCTNIDDDHSAWRKNHDVGIVFVGITVFRLRAVCRGWQPDFCLRVVSTPSTVLFIFETKYTCIQSCVYTMSMYTLTAFYIECSNLHF